VSEAPAKRTAKPVEWFAQTDGPENGKGLRFGCTMCGNCCSGPHGFVLIDDDELTALAKRLGITEQQFKDQYTHMMELGRSLNEKKFGKALDCVFLDRDKFPGKAVCGLYEDRPKQCRTWPFWSSVIASRESWERSKKTCPGIDNGKLHTLTQIRVARDQIEM